MTTPTFTPAADGDPYPPLGYDNSPGALAKVLDATRDWPRLAEPAYPSVGDLMDAHAATAGAPPMDTRVPGRALDRLTGRTAVPAFTRPAFVPGQALADLADLAGTASVQAPTRAAAPVAEPPAAEPFPGWLRGFLVSLIDDAAYGIGAALESSCPLDRHAAAGWCENCQDLYERAGRYARLEKLLQDASDSGAAVRTLLAEGWR
jgi:hypothetical protein